MKKRMRNLDAEVMIYIGLLNTKQKKAVLALLKAFAVRSKPLEDEKAGSTEANS
jgi:hypothetical protein